MLETSIPVRMENGESGEEKKKLDSDDSVFNQTDDFASGCTPFKVAASKAVDKEKKRNKLRRRPDSKNKLEKQWLNIRSNTSDHYSDDKTNSNDDKNTGKIVKETTSKSHCSNNKTSSFDSTKAHFKLSVCDICKSKVLEENYGEHFTECRKNKLKNKGSGSDYV